jgi:uncharacterized protein (DUF1778 family)
VESVAKIDRLNIRVSPDQKRLLESAARISHTTASQFILRAALSSAEEVTADQTGFVLSDEQWTEFCAILDRPACEIPALVDAAAKPRRFRGR